MTEDECIDFFISYTAVDRWWAEWIGWQLDEAGYSTRLQAWDFTPGSDFVHEMQRVLIAARRTIVVLSPEYLSSAFGEAEWRVAFARDPSGEERLLVPVRVRACDPPGLLASRVSINLVDTDESTAKRRLLEGLRAGGARPTRRPRFPGSGPGSIAEAWRFPGGLPPIWSVPYQPHPSFTGRDELLVALRRGFTGSRGTTHRQVLTGLGGNGKTQLAVEYAYRHQADYDMVWWVRAEDRTTLMTDYTALGDRAGLPARPDQDAAAAAVRDWLERQQHQRWLVVFDGVEDPRATQTLLPRSINGHVLLTSRREVDWGGIATPVPVEVLRRHDATDLLLARTGESDRAAAEQLADMLGCLPLALEQAGGLIAQTGVISIARYLHLFRDRSPEMLERGQPADSKHTVATAWNLSLEQLSKESPAAVQLLTLAAFLAPEELPWQRLADHVSLLPPDLARAVEDQLELGQAVVALRRYSLVKLAGGESLIVHRLLQSVIRERLDKAVQRDWAAVAVRLLERSFPAEPSEPPVWPECQRLLPHALQAVGHAKRLGIEPRCNARIIERTVDYLAARGQHLEAKKFTQWLIQLAESVPEQPTAASATHRSLGRVLRDLGKPEEARAHLERALELDQATVGPEDSREAEDRRFLGRVLRELGDLAGARTQLERALELDVAAFGPEDRQVAKDRRTLGRILQNLGDLQGAREQMERALSINEAAYGPDHWRPAYDRCQLGTVLRDLGELSEARAFLEKALEIDTATFGPEHWRAGQDRRYLGTVLRDSGQLDRARTQIELALRIDRTVYDPGHWQVAQDRRYLATVLHKLGELDEARRQVEGALRIDVETYGPVHWRAAQDHRQLGRVLAKLGNLRAARTQLEQALAIDQAVYGPNDWRIAEDCRYHSDVLRQLGLLVAARAQLERALAIDERTFGPIHWRTAQDRHYLIPIIHELGDLSGAQEQLELARTITELLGNRQHPVLLSAIRLDLDRLQRELGRSQTSLAN